MLPDYLQLQNYLGIRPFSFDEICDEFMDTVGDAELVLLGEATHGSREFYLTRAELTKRLIIDKGFNAVAVEADWPDAFRVNRFVKGVGEDLTARASLQGFHRFPQWMWNNSLVENFIEWLAEYNKAYEFDRKVGFYGLDLYSLSTSIDAVIKYLEKVDDGLAQRARERYSCFDVFGFDPETYGYSTSHNVASPCEEEAVKQFLELQRKVSLNHPPLQNEEGEELFSAEQNARLVRDAEEYYRMMFRGGRNSWNMRDTHMATSIDELLGYLRKTITCPRIVIWAHNSHIGDDRATEFAKRGEINLGQLMREKYGSRAKLLGFTTYSGTVTAASEWGAKAEVKEIRPSIIGSYEDLFHRVGNPQFYLSFEKDKEVVSLLQEPRLERAIGVLYLPKTERYSHYFTSDITSQFDAVIHIDTTSSILPLDSQELLKKGLPDTFPSGL